MRRKSVLAGVMHLMRHRKQMLELNRNNDKESKSRSAISITILLLLCSAFFISQMLKGSKDNKSDTSQASSLTTTEEDIHTCDALYATDPHWNFSFIAEALEISLAWVSEQEEDGVHAICRQEIREHEWCASFRRLPVLIQLWRDISELPNSYPGLFLSTFLLVNLLHASRQVFQQTNNYTYRKLNIKNLIIL